MFELCLCVWWSTRHNAMQGLVNIIHEQASSLVYIYMHMYMYMYIAYHEVWPDHSRLKKGHGKGRNRVLESRRWKGLS